MKLSECLSDSGPLKNIFSGFSPRPQQTQMAKAVEQGLVSGRRVVIEAGTGVGKSLAYLLPSALWATANSKKVVVATYTKALQEQLIRKDLPIVQKLLKSGDVALKFSLLMGSENYLCLHRLNRAFDGNANLLISTEQQEMLDQIIKWSEHATTGLRSQIPFDVQGELWESVNRDADVCLGKNGPCWGACLYRKDIAKARDSHILVINQHLLLAGLPNWLDFNAVVIDEAHNLEDVAVSSLGVTLSDSKIKRLLDDTYNIKNFRGIVARIRGVPKEILSELKLNINKTQKESAIFFVSVREKLRLVQDFSLASGGSAKRILEPQIVDDGLTPCLGEIEQILQRCLACCANKEDELQLTALSKRYLDVIKQLRQFLRCNETNYAYWAELRTVRRKPVTLICVKPVDVSAALKEILFDKQFPIILTSATLSVDQSFEHFKQRIGLSEANELLVDSPFDYESNARLFLPHDLPDPNINPEEYDKNVVDFCLRFVDCVPGGIFFLFTSWKTLKNTASEIQARGVKRPVFTQGAELPAKLLDGFKAAKNGILLGTDTFWQGVDVPGAALSAVVITKLPFLPPDTPLEQARQEWYSRQGKAPFEYYILPRAVIKFRQGFGRLIRTQTDFGAVIVLDPRLRTKKYGKVFTNSIPSCPEVEGLPQLSAFYAEKMSKGSSHKDAAAVLALVAAWESKLPRSSIANILRGAASSDVIKKHGQDVFVPHYGQLKGRDYQELMSIIDVMLETGKLSLRNGHLELCRKDVDTI